MAAKRINEFKRKTYQRRECSHKEEKDFVDTKRRQEYVAIDCTTSINHQRVEEADKRRDEEVEVVVEEGLSAK